MPSPVEAGRNKADLRHSRTAHLVVVNDHVHLPDEVVQQIELVRRITCGDLMKPAVAQSDGSLGSHDLEQGVFRLVSEDSAVIYLCARNVYHAVIHIGGGGVLK